MQKVDEAISKSAVGRFFKLQGCNVKGERQNSNFSTEIIAGFTTFIATNPQLCHHGLHHRR